MDLFFSCHHRTNTEDSTRPPSAINFAPYDNRDRAPDALDEVSAGSDDGQSLEGNQADLATMATE